VRKREEAMALPVPRARRPIVGGTKLLGRGWTERSSFMMSLTPPSPERRIMVC
jgi:hypothetical protein